MRGNRPLRSVFRNNRYPLDKGFPSSGLGPYAKLGVAKAGLPLDEMDARGRDGHLSRALSLIPAGHASGDCLRDHAGSNCLEPAVDSRSLLRRGGPRSRSVNDSDRLAEVSVLPFSRLPEGCLGEFLEVVWDVSPRFHRVVEHQGHLSRAVPILPIEPIHTVHHLGPGLFAATHLKHPVSP